MKQVGACFYTAWDEAIICMNINIIDIHSYITTKSTQFTQGLILRVNIELRYNNVNIL